MSYKHFSDYIISEIADLVCYELNTDFINCIVDYNNKQILRVELITKPKDKSASVKSFFEISTELTTFEDGFTGRPSLCSIQDKEVDKYKHIIEAIIKKYYLEWRKNNEHRES